MSFSLEDAAATGQTLEARWDTQRMERNLERARTRRRARVVRTRLAVGLGVLSAAAAALLLLQQSPLPAPVADSPVKVTASTPGWVVRNSPADSGPKP